MRALVFAAAMFLSLPAFADTQPTVQIDYSNPGLVPSQWTMEIHPDGSGHFTAQTGGKSDIQSREIELTRMDRDIQVSPSFAAYVFQTVHRKDLLKRECESHLKVAFQGWKKIHYSGPDGDGVCEFNYSKDKDIQALGESLVAVGSMIIEGARLELLKQHDPLGLDAEIQYVKEAVGDGRLMDVGVIRATLERLEGDPTVLERVRKRAHALLEVTDK